MVFPKHEASEAKDRDAVEDSTSIQRKRTAIIIGAGPAGLTAALELLQRTDIRPIVLQRDQCLGGLSRTVLFDGNRMDIGGHRFFSKSDRVMDWWLNILPLEPGSPETALRYQGQSRILNADRNATSGSEDPKDRVMLVRPRKSRIYYLRQFFDYPVSLSLATLRKLGVLRTLRIGGSYLYATLFPIRNAVNLEQFLINRFGRELYQTFFKTYTEKVWGTRCDKISSEWGEQRIKGLSIQKVVRHYLAKRFRCSNRHDLSNNEETSLIEAFLYPKLGPGQMWEEVARRIVERGGKIVHHQEVDQIVFDGDRLVSLSAVDRRDNTRSHYGGDFFFSTMAVQDFLRACQPAPPSNVQEVGEGLVYRDFITVGMLLSQLKISTDDPQGQGLLRDNWIYIHEPDVRMGRLQIFNNWSPALVSAPDCVWIGLEYFCNDTEALWQLSDAQMIAFAAEELEKLAIIDRADVIKATVVRERKAYPAYFGTYDRFEEVRTWLSRFVNLFPIGRNGMHRYNNQDHSMLAAMTAVDNIVAGTTEKANLWQINTESTYHEAKSTIADRVASHRGKELR